MAVALGLGFQREPRECTLSHRKWLLNGAACVAYHTAAEICVGGGGGGGWTYGGRSSKLN